MGKLGKQDIDEIYKNATLGIMVNCHLEPDIAMTSLTAALTEYIRAKPISEEDISAAELFALDAIANTIAGRSSAPGQKILAWQQDLLGDKSNIGTTGLDVARQAFVHGALCHILEVDDLHRASVVHPGCVVVPVLLALGKGQPRRKVLTALLHGFEACCRVGMAVGKEHYRIWHNTATCGPFGAAMAAATLLDLSAEQTVHALGNAGSQSSGLWEFLNTGAETKHLHAGRAAESGVIAAGLAAHGFTGPPAILEGERGFFRAACPDASPERVMGALDAPWQVHLTSIKPWPSCRHTHPAIDAAQTVREQLLEKGLSDADLTDVQVETYQAALDLCDRVETPSAYAAKFSLQHTVSAALLYDEVTFESFDQAARSALGESRKRVFVKRAEDVQGRYPQHWGTRITAHHKNGETFSAEVMNAKGDPELPLSRGEMISKAERLIELGASGLSEPIISAIQSDEHFQTLYNSIN